MSQKTQELLEVVMAGHEITPNELDEMLRGPVQEDLYLDYKHGDELKKGEPSRTIRQYVSGFANSAGGVLMIGVDEGTWSVTGCSAPGGGDLAKWAASCLTPIAPYFSPLPRSHVVRHPKGDVLVVSTDRSLGLVPCMEGGKLVHYFRFHDQTLQAPEYLISDLVLGRRQHPYLCIASVDLPVVGTKQERSGAYDLYFHPHFVIENESLSWAEGVRLGIVSWTKHGLANGSSLSNHLSSYLEVQKIEGRGYSDAPVLSHFVVADQAVDPFSRIEAFASSEFTVPLRLNYQFFMPYIWRAAIYLMAKGSPPVWYQLNLTVNSGLLEFLQSHAKVSFQDGFLAIERLSGMRPIVTWDWV